MEYEKLLKLRHAMEKGSSVLDDTEALEVPELFPNWEVGKAYAVGDRFQYGEKLYKVLQDHTSQADWTPDTAVSLYVPVGEEGKIYPWERRPSTNPYMKGDKVYFPDYGDPIYESLIDNNVWSPEEYAQGWEVVE